MAGIEQVPSVCRQCAEIGAVERIWEPIRDDPEHVAFLVKEFGIDDDADLVCPDCSAIVIEILIPEGDGSGRISIDTPCPECGHELAAEDGYLLWD